MIVIQCKLLTVEQAAQMLSLRPATIRDWIWRRKIETIRIGRAVRIPEAQIEALIERGTVPALEAR